MKTFSALLAGALIFFSAGVFAAEKGAPPPPADSKEASAPLVRYRPRPGSVGKPVVRVGGATRGTGGPAVAITALAPEHVALTVSAQPSLCWFLTGRARTRLGITINDETAAKPLFEQEFAGDTDTGIRCVDLSAYGVSLAPGIEYQWFAAVINDPEQRSKDVVSSGMIKLIIPEKQLSARISSSAGNLDKAGIYAAEGIWYDALALLNTLIAANPGDKALRMSRADLLEQAGLEEAAAHDRGKK